MGLVALRHIVHGLVRPSGFGLSTLDLWLELWHGILVLASAKPTMRCEPYDMASNRMSLRWLWPHNLA